MSTPVVMVQGTASGEFAPVKDPWLAGFGKPFDFVAWVDEYLRACS